VLKKPELAEQSIICGEKSRRQQKMPRKKSTTNQTKNEKERQAGATGRGRKTGSSGGTAKGGGQPGGGKSGGQGS
jgi:hypothetical protein